MRRGWLSLLIAGLTVSACGSTVPLAARDNPLVTASGAAAAPGVEGALPGQGGLQRTDTLSAGSADVGPSAGGLTSVPSVAGGAMSGAGSSTAAAGPLEIGFEFTDTADGVYQNLSGSSASEGSPKALVDALVAYINAHGGLAGRKVRAIVHLTPYAKALYDPDAAAQEACADFTEDHHVFSASIVTTHSNLVTCLARHGVVTVGAYYVLDRHTFQQFAKLYFAPGAMSLDRGVEAMATRLHTAGWFKGGTVGVLYDETAPYTRAKDALLARLRSLGVHVAKQYGIVSPAGDLSGAAAASSNAVLQFRSAGIDRVLSVDRGGGLFYLFSQAADSQSYYPKYGLNTNSGLMAQEDIAPSAQWANVTAVGWSLYDVNTTNDDARNKQRDVCRTILRAAGAADHATEAGGILVCDQVLFVHRVLELAGNVTVDGFDRAAAGLGPSYVSAFVFSTFIGSGRNDGAVGVRLANVDPACSCLHWVSGITPST